MIPATWRHSVGYSNTDDLWRIRIGDYRVVYAIEDDQLVVIVVRVAGRGKVYHDI